MQDIQRVLKAAARRLYLVGFLRALVVMGTAAAALLLALVVLQKLGPWTFRWPVLFAAATGVSVLASAVAAYARRHRGLALADELDRRAGLRETLSTAVVLAGHGDGWARAVTETARERARRVVLRDAVPIEAPRRWPLPVLLLLASTLGLWLAPRHDLSGLLDRRAEQQAQQAEIQTVALEIKSRDQQIKETLARAGVEVRDEETADDPAEQGKPKTADELKRASIKKLTRLTDELNEIKQGDKAKQLQAMQQSLRKIKTPGPGPMNEFARNLARGNFQDAKAALEELANSLESGELSETQREMAAEQLRKLADQMRQLAEQKESLQNALEQAGMDPQQAAQLAADPEALEQALQRMQGISPQQMRSLMNQAMNQQAVCESMQSMAGSMSQMAQAMQNGNPQNMQSMQQLGQQLTAAEMMQAEMQAIDQALSQCNAQMSRMGQSMCECSGCKSGAGQCTGIGNGFGMGIGEGDGGSLYDPDLAPADDYILKNEKTNVQNLGGPIIGSTLVYGAQVKGEATAQFGEAVGASSAVAAEACETMRVPREYQGPVMHYFGRLEALAKQGDPASPSGQQDKPAE